MQDYTFHIHSENSIEYDKILFARPKASSPKQPQDIRMVFSISIQYTGFTLVHSDSLRAPLSVERLGTGWTAEGSCKTFLSSPCLMQTGSRTVSL
jgi:hypothetical protein